MPCSRIHPIFLDTSQWGVPQKKWTDSHHLRSLRPDSHADDSAGPSQGESGQKDTEDAASTMSHDITVSSQPRTRNGEQSPFRRPPSTPSPFADVAVVP